MKNTYYLIETDSERSCADVLSVYTNKKNAIAECRRKRAIKDAGNGLRRIEGSRERYTERYFITTTDEFVQSTTFEGGFHRVPREAIIF